MSEHLYKNIYLRYRSNREPEGFTGKNCIHELPKSMHKKQHCGYISYDVKNKIEDLSSKHPDHLGFPEICFFEVDEVLDRAAIKELFLKPISKKKYSKINIRQRVSKAEHINSIKRIKAHIQRGDIYEMNYCVEFYAENALIDPISIFEKLNAIAEAPFSSFMKFNEHYIISSSPERFLKRTGTKLISQPIKGTAARGKTKKEDDNLRSQLKKSLKDRTENVMIVDLVRNDLSRIAKEGTVKVTELFGIHSFKQIHQMISSISCELNKNITFNDIIRATFPMGSMTGAPKVSAMELIEKFECTKRGVYSGAMGMIEPNGNFDLSVVIRTILYNSKKKYLSFMVGSAITASSDPEKEYEECMLKAKGMLLSLGMK